jgi:Golgi SNAP receptor complex protein 2
MLLARAMLAECLGGCLAVPCRASIYCPSQRRDILGHVQISEETDSLRMSLDRFSHRQQRRHVEEEQRRELLERRAAGGGSLFDAQTEARAARHVQNSKRVLEEAYEAGVGVLGAMSGQRERLKATHRKVLDVLNRVGLSDSVLRLVERRHRLDKLLVYGGMVATLFLVALFYWWWLA